MSTFKFDSKIPQLIDFIQQAEEKALEEACIEVHRKATQKVRVDTGRLKGSLTYSYNGSQPDGWKESTNPKNPSQPEDHEVKSGKHYGIVGTNVYYASKIEYGSSKSRAFPYLRPAYDESKEKIKTIFKNNFSKVGKL